MRRRGVMNGKLFARFLDEGERGATKGGRALRMAWRKKGAIHDVNDRAAYSIGRSRP